MFRMMVLYIKEEHGKDYVEVAYGKGLSSSYIPMHSFIQKYIYPLLPPFKNDFVFLLSNLFILEFVF